MRLIDADKLTTEKICFYLGSGYASCADDIELMIEDAETIEAEPVVHAHWKNNFCSNCGTHKPYDKDGVYWSSEYCDRCGAKMDEEVDDG